MRYALALLCSLGWSAQSFAADNWPQWRGPQGNAVAIDGDYPEEFSSERGVLWKAKLPGVGSSTPVTWDDRIFVTCTSPDGNDVAVCYDFDGNERWKKDFGAGKTGKHPNGSGSNPSPITDGKRVVLYYKSGRVVALDVDGKELWQFNLQEKYGKDTLWWDLGTSPIFAGGNVVIAVMQEGDSYLAAFDPATGDEVWKQKRQYVRPKESDQAYTTPQVATVDGRETIVTWGADYLTGHDAKTGELIWESAGFNPNEDGMWRVIASQTIGGDTAVVPYGRGKFLAGVKLGGKGDVTESNRLWDVGPDAGADVPTPLVHDGKVYVLKDDGEVTCRDLKTGEEIWQARFKKAKAKFYASPILADGKLYCAREDGKIFVAFVDDQGLRPFAENDIGERVIATIAPVRNSLLIRGEEHLFRVVGGDDGPAASK